ncbi:hypothetical protein DJ70_08075 [Halorubrum halodurans]|uniref:Resolvase n=2 Tax=Halorubrum halodurans TaxID=1383851 RepID=A0A256IJP8_9EURY|nr:hypothetical protein DJ70_08075 [Halorubrum halodurans]
MALRHIQFGELTNLSSTIQDKGSPAVFSLDGTDVVHVFGTVFDNIISDIETVLETPARDCDAVIVDGLADIGGTHREIRDRLDRLRTTLTPHGTDLVIIEADPKGSETYRVDPASDEFEWLLNTLTFTSQAGLTRQRDATREDIERWAGVEYNGGRPPLGFKTVDGCLVPDEPFYSEVCATLELVAERVGDPDGEAGMSKRKAAATLETSSRTITRAIEDRPALYGLPDDST